MLLRQHFRRRHQRSLVPGRHRRKQPGQRHYRLAAPYLSLQQAVHWRSSPPHVGLNLPDAAGLRPRQLERQRHQKFWHHVVRRTYRHPSDLCLGLHPPRQYRQLQRQQLIESQTRPRCSPNLWLVWEMSLEDRLSQWHESGHFPGPLHLIRKRLIHPSQPVLQRIPCEPPHGARVDSLGERIDRHHPARVNPRLLPVCRFHCRRLEHRLSPEDLRTAAHSHSAARWQRSRQVSLPEPDASHGPGIVSQHRLRVLPASPRSLGDHPGLPDRGDDSAFDPWDYLGHAHHVREVLVPSWKQVEQFPDGANIQALESCRRSLVDPFKAGYWGIHRLSFRRCPVGRQRLR